MTKTMDVECTAPPKGISLSKAFVADPGVKSAIKPSSVRKGSRVWKTKQSARSSTLKRSKGLKKSWAKKKEDREARKAQQELAKKLRDELKTEQREEQRKREQKKKQKQENQEKSIVYQVITDTRKIKKMTKKQLSKIRKM